MVLKKAVSRHPQVEAVCHCCIMGAGCGERTKLKTENKTSFRFLCSAGDRHWAVLPSSVRSPFPLLSNATVRPRVTFCAIDSRFCGPDAVSFTRKSYRAPDVKKHGVYVRQLQKSSAFLEERDRKREPTQQNKYKEKRAHTTKQIQKNNRKNNRKKEKAQHILRETPPLPLADEDGTRLKTEKPHYPKKQQQLLRVSSK